MITLIIICLIIFCFKVVLLAIKAAWGITKAIFVVLGMPIILIGLIFAGLATVALPIVIIGVLAAFLIPVLKG